MDHYQTIVGDDCEPHGTSGDWWSSNGNSGGWQQWLVDLTGPGGRFAGKQIEVSITYVSDWSFQGLGVFVDDIVGLDRSRARRTSRRVTAAGRCRLAPAGSAPNSTPGSSPTRPASPREPSIATPDTLYMGFGFEGITDAATRNEVMGKAMDYLLT